MKWLVTLAIVAAAGWAGYDWFHGFMAQEALGSSIEAAIDEPRYRTHEQIRQEIQAAARQQGIELEPSQIELQVTTSDYRPIAGQMISNAGFTTGSQRLTARVHYDRRLWGRSRPVMLERAKVYVTSVTPPQGPRDRLLREVP
jgi:hypothetical protein